MALVVDDDASIRKLLNTLLSRRGWAVIEAEDGVDGVGRALLHHPDVIITDVSMPRSDGIEMLHALKQAGVLTRARVVIITGVRDVSPDVREEFHPTAVLGKPLDIPAFYAAVGESSDEKK